MDSLWERTQPYYALDDRQIRQLMKPILASSTIESCALIRQGLRNTNYHITSSQGHYLLRIYGKNDDWWQKEQALYEHVKNHVSVPALLHFDGSLQHIDKPYAIFAFIDGFSLADIRKQCLNLQTTTSIFQQLGRELAWLHQTEYDAVGFLDEHLQVSTVLPPFPSWYDLFLQEPTQRKLGTETVRQLQNYLQANRENMNRVHEHIVLVHNDFRPINILVDHQHIPYIIDWEGAMAGHALGDIGQFLRLRSQIDPTAENHFIASYNAHARHPLPQDYFALAQLRDLVNWLQLLNSSTESPRKDSDLTACIQMLLQENRYSSII